ncbi:MutS protein msh5 [Mortierella sp. NVP85]|nr:MutS protein msh5 [Mortierella sp. NVP85]
MRVLLVTQIQRQFIIKDLVDIGTFINDVVDFDESLVEGRCVVKHNVDEELDRMRQTYHGLDSFLSEIAKEISQTIPSDFTSTINVIYFPQLGYLITVPMNPNWNSDQDFHLEGLVYQELVVDSFVANDTQLGDFEKSSSTAAVASSTATTGDQQLGDTITDMGSNGEEAFRSNQVMILSGANSSGKSVYLKQVALITYMAHVGSFVPATSAAIGLTDKILTRVQTRETVSSIQSSFMTDLQQVVLALKMATERSLVILDEFGKGTTSTDGAGMFCGVIEHFAKMQHDRPRVMATTHFHELFENQMLNLSLPIALYTMEVYQEPDCLEATFLFRVIPGKTPSSLGPACASMASMPLNIAQRGAFLSRLFQRYEMVIPMLTKHELEMQKMYERLADMLLKLDFDNILDEGAQGNKESRDTAGQPTSVCSVNDSKSIPDNLERHKQYSEATDSKCSDRATLGKRKRSDCEGNDRAETECIAGALDRSIDELLTYAVKVRQKEQEETELVSP